MTHVLRALMLVVLLTMPVASVTAREGDTLEPIQINAPALSTWPDDLLHTDDANDIAGRVHEARASGVPVAIRIVDLSQDPMDLPFQARQYARLDLSQPLTPEQQEQVGQSWVNAEPVESSAGANDGFVLIVLVPEDRTQTQAVWWVGAEALPINGLTQANILATQTVMSQQFADSNMPNGVYLGISEFSYNIQFGEPEQLVPTELQRALRWSTVPLAIVTIAAGVGVPVLAYWCSRRVPKDPIGEHELTPWEAAALQQGRARQEIPAAMLLDAVHRGTLTPLAGGALQIGDDAVLEPLRAYATTDGVVSKAALYEIEAIMQPVRTDIEERMASIGAMTASARADRTLILVAMGITAFLAVLSVVPSVVSMSRWGIFAITIALIGIGAGWWWLTYRSYTTPGGRTLLADWLSTASPEDRERFEMVVHQDMLTDQRGGPDVHQQMRLMRQLRGLGSG